jgi:hypothetical protein
VVATSLCSWFAEDESSFLYAVHPLGRHKVKRLKDDTVRLVDRSAAGCARMTTTGGILWTTGGVQGLGPAGVRPRAGGEATSDWDRPCHPKDLPLWKTDRDYGSANFG